MKRLRFVSFVCVIVLVCVLAAGLPANAATYRGDTVYYTVVNDAMLELTYASMPIMRDGKIYVPYSLFVTYFDVKSSYSAADQVLFLSNASKLVKFDLARGTAYDRNQNEIRQAAILSKGQVFVPAEFTANYFGLSYYLLSDASIVRISDSRATYPDAFLAGQFSSRMESMLAALAASDTASTTEDSGPATSTVSTGTALPEDTTLSRPMSFIELSFAVNDTAVLTDILDWLGEHGVTARFYVGSGTGAGELAAIYVGGHSFGILASGSGDASVQAEAVNDRLFRVLRQKTRFLHVRDGAAVSDAQEYDVPAFAWIDSHDAPPFTTELLSSGQSAAFLFDCSADTTSRLDALLAFMKRTNVRFNPI
ncbi:MAG: stalk domain-containing protein [Eubacteriales bacterium]|nr:stalk domain-containing protein [Eubacteriales bacterium]